MKRLLLTPTLLFSLIGCADQPNPGATVKRVGEPDVVRVSETDVQMEKAIQTARKSVGKLVAVLKAPKMTQQGFSVKKPFPVGESAEHIWLSDIAFDGQKFTGRVANEPVDVQNVKLGDSVTADKREISDWYYLDSGKLIGGQTIRVLYNRLSAVEKKDFRAQTGFDF